MHSADSVPTRHGRRAPRRSTAPQGLAAMLSAALPLSALLFVAAQALQPRAANAAVPETSSRNSQKRAAETERAQLQQKLTALKHAIDGTETARSKATEALSKSEAAISGASRALHDLTQEQRQARERLDALTRQRADLQSAVTARRRQLADLLRDQYIAGNEDRVKLLLSGDDPARIGRSLRYLGYVSQAQARLLENLQGSLAAIERNQAEARSASAELADITAEAQVQKTRLEQEQAAHARIVASLGKQLAGQRAEAGRLQRDEGRLGGLVEQLGKLIEQQQKADADAREKRRRQLALQAQRARRPAARIAPALPAARGQGPTSAGAGSRSAGPDAIDADEAPAPQASKIPSRNESAVEQGVQGVPSGTGLERLRGRLPFPVKGDLVARFGTRREEGPSWKGLFIRAAEGTPVHAVAAGRVVFAEWLRGFGNLIIVDHGNQYLTIYGNNQAVLKHAGDRIDAGDVIASAGNTGGNEQSGLYFEMRFQGRAFDPLGWVTSR